MEIAGHQQTTVIVVDEDPDNLSAFAGLLGDHEIHIQAVNAYDDALISMLTEMPALIMLDLKDRRDTVIKFAELLRSQEKTKIIPIIFIGPMGGEEIISFKGADAGIIECIPRPFTKTYLKKRVDYYIEKHRKKLIDYVVFTSPVQLDIEKDELKKFDILTGMPDRNRFEFFLEKSLTLAKRYHRNMGLLIISVNNIKAISDQFGAAIAKEVMQTVGERILASIRTTDYLSGFFGHKFAVILTEIESALSATQVAQKIINKIDCHYQQKDVDIEIKVSIGISTYPEVNDVSELIETTGDSVRQARGQDINTYQFYALEENSESLNALHIENSLFFAMDSEEFYIEYQPIYDFKGLEVVGLEALLRWHSEDHNLIMPDNFIEIAENQGFIHKIGDWVIKKACDDFSKMHFAKDKPLLSLNVSPLQLRQHFFHTKIASAVKSFNLNPEDINLDLNESIFTHLDDEVRNNIEALGKLGIKMSVDNFGENSISLTHLLDLPIHAVKISRRLINNMLTDKSAEQMVFALITLANNLNLQVVVVGIENKQQMKLLEKFNCQYVQGYLFSKPKKVEDLAV